MFKGNNNKIFKGLPKIFGIADDTVIVQCDVDGRDHDRTLRQVMQICHQENFNKINANSGGPRCHSLWR